MKKLVTLFLFATLASLCVERAAGATRPNFLFIYTGDQKPPAFKGLIESVRIYSGECPWPQVPGTSQR